MLLYGRFPKGDGQGQVLLYGRCGRVMIVPVVLLFIMLHKMAVTFYVS